MKGAKITHGFGSNPNVNMGGWTESATKIILNLKWLEDMIKNMNSNDPEKRLTREDYIQSITNALIHEWYHALFEGFSKEELENYSHPPYYQGNGYDKQTHEDLLKNPDTFSAAVMRIKMAYNSRPKDAK